MGIEVTFWGVRGSFPCAMSSHFTYGGNTSCVELQAGGQTVILDAGTGLWALGRSLLRRGVRDAHLLLSHSHTDHILGFPFFAPAWLGCNFRLNVLAGHLKDNGGIRRIFEMAMQDPVFPVTLDNMGGAAAFHDFTAGEAFELGPKVHVRTAPLNHPNGATGYRIESDGVAVAYITDTEHRPGKPDQNVLDLIQDVDLMIYDSTYTDAEFPAKVGWGHSTWQEAIRLAQPAGVKKLVLFHHDPDHDDMVMAEIEAEAHATWANTVVAREGMHLSLQR